MEPNEWQLGQPEPCQICGQGLCPDITGEQCETARRRRDHECIGCGVELGRRESGDLCNDCLEGIRADELEDADINVVPWWGD